MKKDNFTLAVVLIVVGVALMARQLVPAIEFLFIWPIWGFLVAGLLLALGLIHHDGGLAVQASLLAGVCVNVLLQRQTSVIIWISMLAFLGIGIMLSGLIEPKNPDELRSGLILVVISIVVFMVAGGTKYLPWPMVTNYWPAGLVGLGLILLVSSLRSKPQY
jgi:hypothetical protein